MVDLSIVMETFTRGYLVIFKSHLLLVVSLIFAALHRLWWLNDYHFLVLYGYTPSLDGRDPMIVSWILNYELMDFLNFMANRGYLAQKTLNNQNDLEWVNTIYIYIHMYTYIYIYIYICRTLSPHQKLALQKLVSQLPSQIRWFSVLSGEPKKNIQHIYELFGKSRVRCLNIYIYIYISLPLVDCAWAKIPVNSFPWEYCDPQENRDWRIAFTASMMVGMGMAQIWIVDTEQLGP